MKRSSARLGWVLGIALVACSPVNGSQSAPQAGPAVEVEEDEPAVESEAGPARAETLELAMVGDVIFGRYRDDGFDPIVPVGVDPFERIKPALDGALVVANLETPVVDALPAESPSHSDHRFGADRSHVQLLAEAGVDVVTLANNHLYDLRRPGLRASARILDEVGIVAVGGATEAQPALRVQTVERDGWKLGFIAVTSRLNMRLPDGPPFIPFVRPRDMLERVGPLVDEAKQDHDAVIVSVHWGDEYRAGAAYGQRLIARALVERGVTLVHGHHPHVLQAIEVHEGGIIAYSMGNFLFSNSSKIPRLTGVLRVTLGGRGCIDSARFIPAIIDRPVHRPVPAEGLLADRVRGRVIALSDELGTLWERGPSGDLSVRVGGCSEQAGRAEGAEHQEVEPEGSQ